MSLNEMVIRLNSQQFWSYTAVNQKATDSSA